MKDKRISTVPDNKDKSINYTINNTQSSTATPHSFKVSTVNSVYSSLQQYEHLKWLLHRITVYSSFRLLWYILPLWSHFLKTTISHIACKMHSSHQNIRFFWENNVSRKKKCLENTNNTLCLKNKIVKGSSIV